MTDDELVESGASDLSSVSFEEEAVLSTASTGKWAKYVHVAMAAFSSLPWVGFLISAAQTYSSETAQESSNQAMYMWVKSHEGKLREVSAALNEMFDRYDSLGDLVEDRINSDEYLALVRETFDQWDHTATDEKKGMLKRLITNAGGLQVAQDDLVRMFLDWIDAYHEMHFTVIGEIYRKPGITRQSIWMNIKGKIVRDDSDQADLFRLLIRDLSTGGVIRQERETDYQGRFVKKPVGRRSGGPTGSTMESAFEDTKPYVLTALGSQFVHYVLNDLATPLSG